MRKILIAVAILLTGCQTTTQSSGGANNSHQNNRNSIYGRYKNATDRYTQQHDGAPSQKRAMNVKDPIPTKEPLSRYGNPTDYKVAGRTYQVMRTPIRYKARGMASWYGTKFHKQRTSSGEAYNMYVMSAAHKTLPLPTYVRVTNLDNHKTAIVKVNDRGPFHSDRIIDLSYAAAVKIGVYPKGTAHVEVEAVMGPVGKSQYYIQAGAFSTQTSAKQLKAKLARMTRSPISIEYYQRHYIVRIGPFGSKNSSESVKQQLTRNGLKGAYSVLI